MPELLDHTQSAAMAARAGAVNRASPLGPSVQSVEPPAEDREALRKYAHEAVDAIIDGAAQMFMSLAQPAVVVGVDAQNNVLRAAGKRGEFRIRYTLATEPAAPAVQEGGAAA